MPSDRLKKVIASELEELRAAGTLKGRETVIASVVPPNKGRGPRYLLVGEGEQPFLRMNANSYLGLSLRQELIEAEEAAVRAYGTGPGAARFISGTWAPHVELERRIARFHGRDAAIIFSSAYAAVLGVLSSLTTPETAVISDEFNHNSIINAMRLARPAKRQIYPHLDLSALEACLATAAEDCRRALVVTDGVFSMRGDCAPLDRIVALAQNHDAEFAENVLVVVDDSHGVGAIGPSGRGTEEYVGGAPADLLIGTFGKSFGVNGGYVAGTEAVIEYLREKAPLYVYSNPITQGEAAAALAAVELLDGPVGVELLGHLRAMSARLREGLAALDFESIAGEHPIVPLLTRNSQVTAELVRHLHERHILVTGISYPVVPRGEDEIRFQVSADHTAHDIDEVLAALAAYRH